VVNTVSLYPPLATPGPGILTWSGYMVQTATISNQNILSSQIEEFTPAQELAGLTTSLNGGDANEVIAASSEVSADAPTPDPNEIEQIQSEIETNVNEAEVSETEANEVSLVDETSETAIETEKEIKKGGTKSGKKYVPNDLIEAMKKFGVGVTPLERAHFLAQVIHESGEFKIARENLKYSANRLLQIFPTHINSDTANRIQYNEQAIGNTVYQRSSLGNIYDGDGFKFLGRGWFQITGRSCYKEIGNKIGKDLVTNPNLVEKSPARSETACAYWKLPKFGNKVKDGSDANVKLITYYVNGGYNGLAQRQRLFRELWNELQENPNAYT
jgi:putative chitinase